MYEFIPNPLESIPFISKCEFEIGGATDYIGEFTQHLVISHHIIQIHRNKDNLFQGAPTSRPSTWATPRVTAFRWTAPGSSAPRRTRRSTSSSRSTSSRCPTTATTTLSRCLTARRMWSTGNTTSAAPWRIAMSARQTSSMSGEENNLCQQKKTTASIRGSSWWDYQVKCFYLLTFLKLNSL